MDQKLKEKKSAPAPCRTSPNEMVEHWLRQFSAALAEQDESAIGGLFTSSGTWRDCVSASWNICTAEGKDAVVDMAATTWMIDPPRNMYRDGPAKEEYGLIRSHFTFETDVFRGVGNAGLYDGKCERLFTAADSFRVQQSPTQGSAHGSCGEEQTIDTLIVGGGHAGLSLAAHLKALDVAALIVDGSARPGDSWRHRYPSLHLQDPTHVNHLPFRPFPKDWPQFMSKDELADWLEDYVTAMNLTYWGNSSVRSAHFNADDNAWRVDVARDGEVQQLFCRQLVLATGLYGVPSIPSIPGSDRFAGEICHATNFSGAQGFAGRSVAVVGAGNSAFDICGELVANNANVELIQRSPSCLITRETYTSLLSGGLFNREAMAECRAIDRVDVTANSISHRTFEAVAKALTSATKELDEPLLSRLSEAGFLLDDGIDNTGVFGCIQRTGTGYIVDAGTGELIINGDINVVTGAISEITPNGLVMADGQHVDADAIVFATGYRPFEERVSALCGDGVAARIGKVWGVGSGTPGDPGPWTGEQRNMWKPTAQEGLWIHGGSLSMSRYYSKILALQIAARIHGVAGPVYEPSYSDS